MRITIIGGSGFVGSNVRTEFLLTNSVQNVDLVQNISKQYAELVVGDVTHPNVIEQIKTFLPDCIIVLAGQQYLSPQVPRGQRAMYFQGNIKIAQALSSAYSEEVSPPKLLFVSTDMVYGLPKLNIISETTPPKPIGEYGKSKLEAENVYQQVFKDVAIVRPRLIVGPGRAGTIKSLATLIKRGLPIPIIGDGKNRYQMIGVSDLWLAIEKIIDKETSGVFNIGSDAPPTLNDLFIQVKKNLELKNPVVHLNPRISHSILGIADRIGVSPLAYEQYALASETCLLSTSKIKALGWTPELSDSTLFINSLSYLLNKTFSAG